MAASDWKSALQPEAAARLCEVSVYRVSNLVMSLQDTFDKVTLACFLFIASSALLLLSGDCLIENIASFALVRLRLYIVEE